jgi:superfamily II DNA or RNA helicase
VLLGDEVHRYGADKWKQIFSRFPAKTRIGLTATPERLDGFWPLIVSHIGPILVENSGNYLVPRIFGVKINTYADPSEYGASWANLFIQNAKILKILECNPGRNDYLVKWTVDAYKKGRKIMFASAKRNHLTTIHNISSKYIPIDDMSFYVGGMKKKDRIKAEDASVIFTTYQMTAEGLDIPDLDLLIMGLPRTSIKQAVGRTLREFEGKGRPVIIDPIDYQIPNLHRSWLNRKNQYETLQYEVIQ